MFELPPAGYSEAIPAFLKIAKAHWPDCFAASDVPDDPQYYATILHILFRQTELLGEQLPSAQAEELRAFNTAFYSVRRALSDGQIGAYYVDDEARARPVIDYRHWATDDGLDELLLGTYFDVWHLKDRQILLRDDVVAQFLPKQSDATTTAKGRIAFAARLKSIMEASPENPRPKAEVFQALHGDFPSLAERQREKAWTEVARQFPSWSHAGRRKHSN